MPQPRSPVETYISSVQFRLPFEQVWTHLTDPLEFPRLYPGWASHMERTDRAGVYSGLGPLGSKFSVVPRLSREHGVMDFEVTDEDGRVEHSRSRLFPLKDGGCILLHLAVRWESMEDEDWAQHQQRTDADLEHARRLLERNPPTAVQGN